MGCKCYVRFLTEVTRYGLHYGAHNPSCPQYRVSLDPVDRANDEDFRATTEECRVRGVTPQEPARGGRKPRGRPAAVAFRE